MTACSSAVWAHVCWNWAVRVARTAIPLFILGRTLSTCRSLDTRRLGSIRRFLCDGYVPSGPVFPFPAFSGLGFKGGKADNGSPMAADFDRSLTQNLYARHSRRALLHCCFPVSQDVRSRSDRTLSVSVY